MRRAKIEAARGTCLILPVDAADAEELDAAGARIQGARPRHMSVNMALTIRAPSFAGIESRATGGPPSHLTRATWMAPSRR